MWDIIGVVAASVGALVGVATFFISRVRPRLLVAAPPMTQPHPRNLYEAMEKGGSEPDVTYLVVTNKGWARATNCTARAARVNAEDNIIGRSLEWEGGLRSVSIGRNGKALLKLAVAEDIVRVGPDRDGIRFATLGGDPVVLERGKHYFRIEVQNDEGRNWEGRIVIIVDWSLQEHRLKAVPCMPEDVQKCTEIFCKLHVE